MIYDEYMQPKSNVNDRLLSNLCHFVTSEEHRGVFSAEYDHDEYGTLFSCWFNQRKPPAY